MKHLNKSIILLFTTLFIAGCNNSVERTDRTVSLVQENVTSIVNELTEIQLAEGNIQAEFENTIANASDDLSYFANNDSPIQQNIQRRQQHLTKPCMNILTICYQKQTMYLTISGFTTRDIIIKQLL